MCRFIANDLIFLNEKNFSKIFYICYIFYVINVDLLMFFAPILLLQLKIL